MTLPTITIEGQAFFDISGIVRPDVGGTRTRTDGLALHHSVTAPIPLTRAVTMEEKIAIIKAIDEYHVSVGYGGFGYNGCTFGDGTVCVVGLGLGKRAHVANHNGHLEGMCVIGDYSNGHMPVGAYLGVARWLVAKRKQHRQPQIRLDGHRSWVTDPAWATACPGNGGMATLPDIYEAADAIEREGDKAARDRAAAAIRAALQPNWDRLALAALHGQLHFLGL